VILRGAVAPGTPRYAARIRATAVEGISDWPDFSPPAAGARRALCRISPNDHFVMAITSAEAIIRQYHS
jgi:hypothetical protein